ncbi:MAG: hypothetical protein ACLGHL_11285, partial [Actinomycetota bacterium]
MVLRILATSALIALVSGCGGEPTPGPVSGPSVSPSVDPLTPEPLPRDQLYEGTGVVLDAPDEDP